MSAMLLCKSPILARISAVLRGVGSVWSMPRGDALLACESGFFVGVDGRDGRESGSVLTFLTGRASNRDISIKSDSSSLTLIRGLVVFNRGLDGRLDGTDATVIVGCESKSKRSRESDFVTLALAERRVRDKEES